MSTYWGYVCLGCQQTSEFWLNHGDQVLGALLVGYSSVRDQRPDLAWQRLRVLDTMEGPGEFIFDHWGHQLALANEYGQHRLVVAPPVCAIVGCVRVATRRIAMRSADRGELVAIPVCDLDFDLHPTRSDYRPVGDG